jgi:hypothetical protein
VASGCLGFRMIRLICFLSSGSGSTGDRPVSLAQQLCVGMFYRQNL